MDELINIKGKVCVVTGAGKGIGREIAIKFANLGCSLALISRTQEDLDSLVNELNISREKIFVFKGDVSSPEVVEIFVENVVDRYGRIDVLVNNAGIRFRKSFLEITYEEWVNVINVNLGSTFLFCQKIGQHMLKQKSGKIINMASIVGTLGLPELTGYAASKGGVISLTKSLAVEWAEHNINVNVIAPGFCETSYTENFKKKKELYEFTLERTPMKKWGASTDIANACVFLASDMSSYITGEVLNVDGGWSAW